MVPGYGNIVTLKCVLPSLILSDHTHKILLEMNVVKDEANRVSIFSLLNGWFKYQ